MNLDVKQEHLRTVRNILRSRVPKREVWAFGSRVKGKASAYSDLDLVMIGDEPLSFEALGDLGDAFSLSDIPYKVDVIDWAYADEQFRSLIAANHLVIQRPR